MYAVCYARCYRWTQINNFTYKELTISQGGNQVMKKRKLSWWTADWGQGWGMWKKVAMVRR